MTGHRSGFGTARGGGERWPRAPLTVPLSGWRTVGKIRTRLAEPIGTVSRGASGRYRPSSWLLPGACRTPRTTLDELGEHLVAQEQKPLTQSPVMRLGESAIGRASFRLDQLVLPLTAVPVDRGLSVRRARQRSRGASVSHNG